MCLFRDKLEYKPKLFMLLKIETEIIGNFSIEEDMKIKLHPYNIDIRFDLEMEKHYISLCKRMINYSYYLPKLEINKNETKTIKFPSEDFLKEQVKILQHIESFGAIDKGVKKNNWNNCFIEWIPESKIERKELSIRKYNRDLTHKSKKEILTKSWLQNTILHKRQLEHLALPFSFFPSTILST